MSDKLHHYSYVTTASKFLYMDPEEYLAKQEQERRENTLTNDRVSSD